jgi:putative intracellular protease/amidase
MQTEILIYEGFDELDAIGPFEVLRLLTPTLVTLKPTKTVTGSQGLTLIPHATLSKAPGLLIVPGGGWLDRSEHGAYAEYLGGEILTAITERHARGTTIASVCTGAMLLAKAGLLNGRPAVTNHAALEELAAEGAQVVAHARVVDDGEIITAGGVTAGIDLALWLVERELGPSVAARIAGEIEHPRIGMVWRAPKPAELPVVTTPRDELALPDGPLATVADSLARGSEPDYLYNHSVRSYLFARVAARARGLAPDRDFDENLLFISCILHDIGLTEAADRGSRFEVDGADAAVQLLCANGLDPQAADLVWQAIALHTSGGIAERRAPEIALTRAGIAIDLGGEAHLVSENLAAAIHRRYPRLQIARNLTDAIVDQARGRPQKTPSYSLPAGLVTERSHDPCVTRIERHALASRWGE